MDQANSTVLEITSENEPCPVRAILGIIVDAPSWIEDLPTIVEEPASEIEAMRIKEATQVTAARLKAEAEALKAKAYNDAMTKARADAATIANEAAEARRIMKDAQMDAARIALEQARIARDRAQVALDDRTLEAPFDGIIGLTEIDPGDRITITTPVATSTAGSSGGADNIVITANGRVALTTAATAVTLDSNNDVTIPPPPLTSAFDHA